MEKKNTVMKISIVILCLLVVGLTGYIVYDKTLNLDNSDVDLNNTNDNQNNNIDNSVVDNNSSLTCNCENSDSIKIDYSKLTDMGTGINIKAINGFNYQLSITSKGVLTYLNKSNGTRGSINIKNVTDIQYLQYFGEENGEYFILTADGQLYTITENLMNSGGFDPIKDVKLGKIIKIGSFSTCKPNAGCGTGIYCLTADGKTEQIVFRSV